MNESTQQTHPAEQHPAQETRTAWQTPEFTEVDTALEVTAYSLNSR
ncbi:MULTISPECIES: pyrroloquinoline quinone precursor peptide PqqA [unclassified Streptomyces]|nr:pyrroloquinoline quinone precursor peptide PqqA [Streptomyces sp. TSRI0107]OKJ87964.1 pyrroloquinoline quinone biosynthesis protein PqqA [Streptomyces sp. TSRI0107]